MPDTAPRHDTAARPAHELVRRVNDFLTLCLAYGDNGLATKAPDDMSLALENIVRGAEEMADYARAYRFVLATEGRRSDSQ